MAAVWAYTILSVILVSLVSLVGVITLTLKDKTFKKIIIYLVSFSAGALFGGAFIHLLPEAFEKSSSLYVSSGVLAGIVTFFVIERFIHWRHCHLETTKQHVHPVGFLNLFGDGVHNFIDGLIIAAAYIISIPIGIITTIAVLLHEIPQEIGDFGILVHAGFSKKRALFFNFLSAIAAIVGAVVGLAIGAYSQNITLFMIPFAAGGFIYIAGSDLIPELHRDVCVSPLISRTIWQFAAFLLGIAIMFAFVLVE